MITQLFQSPKSIWEAPTQSVLSGDVAPMLPGPWKLMLLGDGSPTRHLNLLTNKKVEIALIGMESPVESLSGAPIEIEELKKPILKRQVWLRCGSRTMAWAESWWNKEEADFHLCNKNQPIWDSLNHVRSELFREVDGLGLVEAKWLEKEFNCSGPFWSRHYRFIRQEKELTVIREVFNPLLQQWLGPLPTQGFDKYQ